MSDLSVAHKYFDLIDSRIPSLEFAIEKQRGIPGNTQAITILEAGLHRYDLESEDLDAT
jgi:hypothetical protein